jgi:hypothetical protein
MRFTQLVQENLAAGKPQQLSACRADSADPNVTAFQARGSRYQVAALILAESGGGF